MPTTTAEKAIPTPDQVRESVEQLRRFLDGVKPVPEYTIQDYPIGSRRQGQCKLSVERNRRGSRTVRTTTNRYGHWCQPKKSTYNERELIVVVAGDGMKHDCAWLRCGVFGVYLQYANGENEVLAPSPHWCQPHREPRPYTITVNRATPEKHQLEADPPELCDAWEAWVAAMKPVMLDLAYSIKALAQAA